MTKMTTELVEPGPDRSMTPEEHALAEQVYEAIQQVSNYSERSQQSADFRIGISDLGFCSEKVRRMLAGIPEPITDKTAAFIGTALGDHIEQACQAVWHHAIRQAEVTLQLLGDGGRTYTLIGHPDLIDPTGVVIDIKTTRGLSIVRRNGPSRQQQFQRHCYAMASMPLFNPDVTLDKVRVANVWFDRAGDEPYPYVQMEDFSPQVVAEAAMFVDDLVYAFLHGEAARKEPPREVCAKACGHFADCRALDTDVEGLLTDPDILTAVDLHRDALAMERKARQMKDQARSALVDISGSTGKFSVRWVHVGGGHVEYDRKPSARLDIKPMT
jgi:hypothetical protein